MTSVLANNSILLLQPLTVRDIVPVSLQRQIDVLEKVAFYNKQTHEFLNGVRV